MGCCLSTNAAAAAAAGDESKTNSKQQQQPMSRFEEEEETVVKQVLTETPKKPPNTNPISTPMQIKNSVKLDEENELSEVVSSEIYSYSATTTTTTTIGVEIDEDGEVNKPPNKPKLLSSKTTTTTTRARTKRGNQTPAARRTSQRHPNANVARRESLNPPLPRRRVRTNQAAPQIRNTTSSVRNSGKRIPPQNKVNAKFNNDDAYIRPSPVPEQETVESLENPLVSLECFIFL